MVRLIRYNILRRKYRVLTILLILVCAIVFTFSLSIILSLFNGVSLYLSGGRDELIILGGGSSTPFTGIIDLSITRNISQIPGVIHVSPELPIPVYIDGHPVIARGIDPDSYSASTEFRVLDGGFLEDGDCAYVVAGRDVAERLGLKVGEEIIVTSVLDKAFQPMVVKGIIDAPEPYNSEVLVALDFARVMRGSWGNYSSIIRVVVEDGEAGYVREAIEDMMSRHGVRPGVVERSGESMGFYLRKYGFDINILFVALIPPLFISLVSLRYLIGGLLEEHSDIINILHDMGFSMRGVRANFILQMILHVLAATLAGFLLGSCFIYLLWRLYDIRFLIHIPPISLPIHILIVSLILFTSLSIYYLYVGWRLDEED